MDVVKLDGDRGHYFIGWSTLVEMDSAVRDRLEEWFEGAVAEYAHLKITVSEQKDPYGIAIDWEPRA